MNTATAPTVDGTTTRPNADSSTARPDATTGAGTADPAADARVLAADLDAASSRARREQWLRRRLVWPKTASPRGEVAACLRPGRLVAATAAPVELATGALT